jgi:acetamidase/formamidase
MARDATLHCERATPNGIPPPRTAEVGGNLDYNDNVEGTTVYLPVFHAGALLGMGDGEVTNSALETSMDVDFSIELIKGELSGQVRAETKDYLIAFGDGGSVPDFSAPQRLSVSASKNSLAPNPRPPHQSTIHDIVAGHNKSSA